MHEKEMPASQSLPFLLHVSLYHEFATQESLTSKTLFSNRKVRSIINTNKNRTDEREKQ